MTELRKRTFLGFDLTSRTELWGEIARLGDKLASRERTLTGKQEECSRKQARVDVLEKQAAMFATQRNEADRRAIDLRAQLAEADHLNDEMSGQLIASDRERADLAAQLAEAELRLSRPVKRRRASKKQDDAKPADSVARYPSCP